MSQFSFRLPRAYRLKPVAQREDDALSLLRIGSRKIEVLRGISLDIRRGENLVARGGISLPRVLVDVSVLIAGGMKELFAR